MKILVTHETVSHEVVKSDKHSKLEYTFIRICIKHVRYSMLSMFLIIIKVSSSDCIFIELSRTGSLSLNVWEIYACV